MITWVIGSGGLLGSAIARRVDQLYRPQQVPWQDPQESSVVLHQQAREFEAHCAGAPWRIIWAAGSATTATAQDTAMVELRPLEGLLTGLRSAMPSGAGSFFLTSSAGGVYAGAQEPPFSTTTPPVPLSPYGELKLAQEALSTEMLRGLVPVTIGRISNLYGPGQNLQKLQGLISRLALAAVTRSPINIFVPLETIRDYLYVDDAAAVILQATDLMMTRPKAVSVEIVAAGSGATVGQLIRLVNEVSKKRVPVALGVHHSRAAQATDLRLIPTLTPSSRTPLPVGVQAIYMDILARIQTQTLGLKA